jgi:hypothetical protein
MLPLPCISDVTEAKVKATRFSYMPFVFYVFHGASSRTALLMGHAAIHVNIVGK